MSCIDRYRCPIHWFTHPDCPVRPLRWRKDWKEAGLTCPRPELRRKMQTDPASSTTGGTPHPPRWT